MTSAKVFFAAGAMAVLLGGCTGADNYKLNRAQPVGSPFNTYLSQEYRKLANRPFSHSAPYFARKGLAAAEGIITEPDTIDDWSWWDEAESAQLAEDRATLIDLLNGGARDFAPDQAAIAQTRFDCMITVYKKKFPGAEGASCKDEFDAAIGKLKEAQAVAPPPQLPPPDQTRRRSSFGNSEFPAPIGLDGSDPEALNMGALDEAAFLVFFDWDQYVLSDSARGALDAAVQAIKQQDNIRKVTVVGHTDTSGGETYNLKLSARRAEAVSNYLTAHGIPAGKVAREARGESEQRVRTSDEVREPQNRRAQITFE